MRQAELITAEKRITVTIAETAGGMMVISHQGKPIMAIRPVAQSQQPQRSARAWTIEETAARPETAAELRRRLKQIIMSDEFPRLPKHKKLEPMIEYFLNSPEDAYGDMSDLAMDLMSEYKKLTGQRYEATAQSESQLEQDLKLVKRYVDKIINDSGDLARGWQSRIAEYLNLPGTGGSHRRRIFNIGNALREFYLSTRVEKAENAVEGENKRVIAK